MPHTFASNMPKQKLIFYVAQDIDNSIKRSVHELVDGLTKSRSWVIAAPRIVEGVDKANDDSPEDVDLETIGGELEIYSASDQRLPQEIDRQHFEEVEACVEAVRKMSERMRLVVEFELDGVYVGAIENGNLSRTLQVGLLDEWKKQLG